MTEEQERFEKADKRVHPVENQWHYEYMVKYGFTSIDKQGVGFVRSYRYQKDGHVIRCVTGVNADYWEDKVNGGFGYWADLEPHLKKISTECACTHEAHV